MTRIASPFASGSDACELYNMLLGECCPEGTEPTAATYMMVADVVRLERLKAKLQDDIDARGIGCEMPNGKSRYWQDNKSVSQLGKAIEQQHKLMRRLGLAQDKPDQPDEVSDEDGFDDL